MPGKTSDERRVLEDLSGLLSGQFEAAGYDFISPDILQPADVFLDRSGEDIRSRTFVFTDPEGNEQCLRPDLTVPACRFHLSHVTDPGTEARYCYSGPAFRYKPGEHPHEFHQTGIEWFGGDNPEASEADVLSATLAALEAAGLTDYTVRIGDLGVFHALLSSLTMSERWRRRLQHHFWRPRAFRALLQILTGTVKRPRTSISPLIDELPDGDPATARARIDELLERDALELIGGRTVDEIAGRIAEKAADRLETPLAANDSKHIDDYLAVRGALPDTATQINEQASAVGGQMSAAARRFEHRVDLFRQRGLAVDEFEFSAVFGRSLEYYTGLVFQIDVADPAGGTLAVAGGGRYDDMLEDIGAGKPVPAVGCAIYTERLLAVTGGSP